MTYDPKTRPVFLGRDADRTNPDRLKIGVMSVADNGENKIEPVQESALAKIMKVAKPVAAVLVGLAGITLGLEAQGVPLPPAVRAVALSILGIGGALGIHGTLDQNGDGKIDEKDFEQK